jgi:hypothetical protein
MKYLVIKGWLGFGDRFETLKMGLQYALTHNLMVYVDWRDSIWSHGDENFYTYFEIQNIPQIKSLSEIPEDATYYPEYWKGRIEESITQQHCLDAKKLGLDIGREIHKETFSQDVIVLSNVGYRILYTDNTFLGKVLRVRHPRILEKLRHRWNTLKLATSLGVHLRGTDRYRTKEQKLKAVQWNVVSAVSGGALNGIPMVVVSDDRDCFELWKKYFPQSVLASDLSLDIDPKKGNHNIGKDTLKISKDELNVGALSDFFTLALCSRIYSTHSDSRFAKEAIRIHSVARTILGI